MSRHHILTALALGSALVLSACATTQTPETTPEKVVTDDTGTDTGGGADPGTDAGAQQGSGSDGAPKPVEADAATQAYLDCLLENGVDAIIDPSGKISLGVAQKGGTIETGADSASSPAAAAQATCQEQVPEYAAPNENQK